jgi:hypothetical protein
MFKRLAISFWVLCAFALLQAHNFIPHHHTEMVIGHSHSHDRHHHDQDEEDNDESEPFTHLQHSSDFEKVITKPFVIKDVIAKPIASETFFSRLYNTLASLENPPKPHPPDDDSPLHVIFLSHSLPLRAPPALHA